jgi:hypothetical protein
MVIRTDASMPMPDTDAASSRGSDAQQEIARARALVDQLGDAGQRSTAEMLQELRRAFPDSPLAVRVRALDALRKR